MRYSVCAALTAVLVAFVAEFLLRRVLPDVGACVACAVKGAVIYLFGNHYYHTNECEDIPEDNLRS